MVSIFLSSGWTHAEAEKVIELGQICLSLSTWKYLQFLFFLSRFSGGNLRGKKLFPHSRCRSEKVLVVC
jgi:hypothetical protein